MMSTGEITQQNLLEGNNLYQVIDTIPPDVIAQALGWCCPGCDPHHVCSHTYALAYFWVGGGKERWEKALLEA